MLTVGNKIYFMTSPSGTKSCSGTRTMSLKTTSQLLLTSNYSLNLRHQNHNLPPFFKKLFYVAEQHGKVESTALKPWKIKKNKVLGLDPDLMKLKSQQLQSVWSSKGFQDVTVAVKWDTSCCNVIVLWPSQSKCHIGALLYVTPSTISQPIKNGTTITRVLLM